MRTIKRLFSFIFGFSRFLITFLAYRISFLKSNSENDIFSDTHFIYLFIFNDFLAILRIDFIKKGIMLIFWNIRIKVFF